MKSFLTVFFATSLLCLPARAQSVLVVDAANGPGTRFQSLETAIQSAASGDVLLVRSGDYEVLPTVTIGKSLVLQAESGATVRVNPGLVVQGLPAGERVVVRNLTLGGITPIIFPVNAVRATSCQGSIWFEDCVVPGSGDLASSSGGAWILDCASVVFSRCTVGPFFDNLVFFQNFVTFNSARSTVHLYDSTILGADGTDSCSGGGGPSPAIQVTDGELWITGSVITGGRGSDGGSLCQAGGQGSSGLVLAGTSPSVFLMDSEINSGAGGTGLGGAPDGGTSSPIRGRVGQVTQIPGAARRLSASALLRDDRSTVLSVQGAPGDLVWLVTSRKPGPRILLPILNRPLLLAAPYSVISLGMLDASGTKTLVVGPRDLGTGLQAASFHLQALFWNTTLHERAWSAPSHVQVVDAAF